MKKLLCLFLSVLILLLASCQLKPSTPPAVTTGAIPPVTTAPPEELPPPTHRMIAISPSFPRDLPEEPPTGIDFEVLYSYQNELLPLDPFCVNETLLIQSKDELNSYFFRTGDYPEGYGAKEIYKGLSKVDFSKKALLLMAGESPLSLEVSLSRIFPHGNNLIATYEILATEEKVSYRDSKWWDIVLLNRDDLPRGESDTGLFYSFVSREGEESRFATYPELCRNREYVLDDQPLPESLPYRLKKLESPYHSTSDGYTEWRESLNLLDTLPDSIEYEVGFSYGYMPLGGDAFRPAETLVITNREELDSYFFREGYDPALSGPSNTAYRVLSRVDFDEKAVIFLSGYSNVIVGMGLKTVVEHDGALIAVYESLHNGDGHGQAFEYWGHVLLVDKELLSDGGNTPIYHCYQYPNYPEPRVFPDGVIYPTRYVFVPIDEEE